MPFCPNCGKYSEKRFCSNCGISLTASVLDRAQRVPKRFPLRTEHKLLICLAAVSAGVIFLLPIALAPLQPTITNTYTTTRTDTLVWTSVRYETKTTTNVQTYTYSTTSLYTNTYTETVYVTVVYTYTASGTGYFDFQGQVTTVVPMQVERIQVQSRTIAQTQVVTQMQTGTETQSSMIQSHSTAVESSRTTTTLPYTWAIARSYSDSLAWLAIGLLVPIFAYHRVNAYRTRLHIYYQMLAYTMSSPKLPSHIMRACNLETSKFEKYIQTLAAKGFVDEIRQNGTKVYRTSRKGFDIVRNEKLTEFMRELP